MTPRAAAFDCMAGIRKRTSGDARRFSDAEQLAERAIDARPGRRTRLGA